MEKGYYWIKFRPDKRWPKEILKPTVGYYEGEIHDDGSPNTMPWQVVGSDEIFRNDQIDVIRRIDEEGI
jgi:hypothetical protein